MNTISGFPNALAGIHQGINRLQQDAQVIASSGEINSVADTDVTEAIVDLKTSSHQVEVSAKVISAQNAMLGTLFDEMA